MSPMIDGLIDGLNAVDDFVSVDEEAAIVRFIGVGKRNAGNTRNRVLRYGPGVGATGYSEGIVVPGIAAPLDVLCDRLVADGLVAAELRPNAVTVNEYQTGQGLEFHTDHVESGETISILALASSGALMFSRGRVCEVAVPFPRRRLIQISGTCRHLPWRHGIAPVTELRYSVVFRHGVVTSADG